MIAARINKRPNCEEILSKRNSWALSLNELTKNKDFTPENRTIEDSFHLFFIKAKYDLSNK